jgi:triosephosphate isomerase
MSMKKSKKIIVGNWKMDPASPNEAEKIFTEIQKRAPKFPNVHTIVCPSFVHIQKLAELARKKVSIGAQNMFHEATGSFTGEVSVDMLKKIGAGYMILGHSEQRKLGETDEIINKKVHLTLKAKLIPIICIGEDKRDEDGHYLNAIKFQLEHALIGIQKKLLSSIIIAYEPVWAIGATEAMNARDIHEMTIFIKKSLVDLYKIRPPVPTPILYGGSVDPMNAHGILSDGEADGLLIGRQSLNPESFIGIIRIANSLKKY